MAACRDANFFPESVVGVNAANAVVVGRGSRSVMYVRWEGNNKRMRPTWTFDAALLARGWKRKSQRLIEEALADQATPRRVVSYRWRLLDSRRK
jgi:hypothetical protein